MLTSLFFNFSSFFLKMSTFMLEVSIGFILKNDSCRNKVVYPFLNFVEFCRQFVYVLM